MQNSANYYEQLKKEYSSNLMKQEFRQTMKRAFKSMPLFLK
jgi:hypothetical protein